MRWNPFSIIGGCAIIAVFFILAVSCAVVISEDSGNSGVKSTEPREQAPSESKFPKKETKKIGSFFGDGVYLVGTDVAAGSYKTEGPDSSDILDSCYWSRNKDDSGELDSIIANDNITGPGRVTLNTGEIFEASGDCVWVKQ